MAIFDTNSINCKVTFFLITVYSDSEVTTNPDDLLPPIEKLEKYADSENIFNR